jgi:hypothetical protein
MLSLAYASLELSDTCLRWVSREPVSPATGSPRHRVAASPRRKLPADLHRTFDHIDVLEDLQTQVIVEVRIVGEKLVDDRERFRRLLSADECREPAVDEEDLSIAFVIRVIPSTHVRDTAV